MKVNGIGKYRTINRFVRNKLDRFDREGRTFEKLYALMFNEADNVMAEKTDGHRIIKTTYGECHKATENVANALSVRLCGCQKGDIVGLSMNNSIEWIEVFWAILMCGYKPLLINTRLDDTTINGLIDEYKVAAVVTDERTFNTRMIPVSEITGVTSQTGFKTDWEDEIIVMSSGTSEVIKLCVYNGEKFYYQIKDSAKIVKECRQIKKHYEGNLKLLTFLPFYHIFGLSAMYMWFGFFSRTFVFLKDFSADTILNTVKKHKVTHIFCVPLLWNKIYVAAMKKIHDRGEKTFETFNKGMKLVNKLRVIPPLSRFLSKVAFKEVRENIFGESICFLITGGSMISTEVISFFNGIGYHIANGFGMSEIGITSVETSKNAAVRNTGSIGKPFASLEYMVNDEGELLVRGKSTASYILKSGEKILMDHREWFNTHDIVTCQNGRYYIAGRKDDMIASKSGENINPNRVEGMLKIPHAYEVCLVSRKNDLQEISPVLIIQVAMYQSASRYRNILDEARKQLADNKLDGTINEIVLTTDELMGANDFKLNRHRIGRLYSEGKLTTVDVDAVADSQEEISAELLADVRAIFADALTKEPEEIDVDAHFFFDLEGTSLDYLAMMSDIRNKYDIVLSSEDGDELVTLRKVCEFIQNNM